MNLYAYCHNNPVGYVDPSGHDAKPCKYKDKAIKHLMKKEGLSEAEALKKWDDLRAEGVTPSNASKYLTGKIGKKGIQTDRWKKYTGLDPTGEVHHGLPEKFRKWFEQHGIKDIDSGEFYYDLTKEKHRKKVGNGLHTNKSGLTLNGKPSNWNAVWKDFIEKNPKATPADILEQLQKMEEQTGIAQYRAKPKK